MFDEMEMVDYFPGDDQEQYRLDDRGHPPLDLTSQTLFEHSEGASCIPSSSQQNVLERRCARRRLRKLNQPIWQTICPNSEFLGAAGFLSNYNGTIVTYPNVLISTNHFQSYMSEETLDELGYQPYIPTHGTPKKTVNPRDGSVFRPIGGSSIYIWLNGPEPIDPILVDFYVVPGPLKPGVRFILGMPDIKRIWPGGWTPQQHVERMSRVEEGRFMFGPGPSSSSPVPAPSVQCAAFRL